MNPSVLSADCSGKLLRCSVLQWHPCFLSSSHLYNNYIWVSVKQSQLKCISSCFSTIELEQLRERRSACVFDDVEVTSVGLSKHWESEESLLASVESIPDVIHEGVEFNFECTRRLSQVNWLNRSIHSVSVQRFKFQYRHIVTRADLRIPCGLMCTFGKSTV